MKVYPFSSGLKEFLQEVGLIPPLFLYPRDPLLPLSPAQRVGSFDLFSRWERAQRTPEKVPDSLPYLGISFLPSDPERRGPSSREGTGGVSKEGLRLKSEREGGVWTVDGPSLLYPPGLSEVKGNQD